MDGDFAMKGCGFCSHQQWEFLKKSIKVDGSSALKHSRAALPGTVQEIYSLHLAGPANYHPSSLL